MRYIDAITVKRLMEVIEITDDGLVKFRVKNGHNSAGSHARIRKNGSRFYVLIDGRKVDMIRAAWAYHHGEWPDFTVVQDVYRDFDFRAENIQTWAEKRAK